MSLPPAELRPWVDDVETVPVGDGVFVQVPEVATTLVFRRTAAGRSDLIAVGPRSRGSYHRDKPLPVCLRMHLRPGHSRALLGVPISDLVDRTVSVHHLWGAEGARLIAELAANPGQALSHLTEALPRFAAIPGPAAPLEPATRALASGAPTSAAAERLGISERHLRTIFAREVGLSPKHYARITRLRRALSLAGAKGWAQVAGDLGYFDQAHLITDFRTLMGVSPGAFTAGRLPPVSPCGSR